MAGKKAAFQGERGAFSEVAAQELVGRTVRPVPCESFEILFEAVKSGRADVGVLPIENSLIGTILNNLELLHESDLTIIGESQLRVVHCLITLPDLRLRNITKVYSHPAALNQCRNFFRKHPRLESVPYYDTAGAVKMLTESHTGCEAAIASPYAARIYGMKLLKESIEDEKCNYTRFLLLGRKSIKFKGQAKTSIVFSLRNEPGILFKALSVFALRDINLIRIESRPSRRKAWEYYFYIDFAGSAKESKVRHALDHLAEITHFIKVLGSYPKSVNGS